MKSLPVYGHSSWSPYQREVATGGEDPLSFSVMVPSKSVKKMILGFVFRYGSSVAPILEIRRTARTNASERRFFPMLHKDSG